ncbi:MAG: glycoside hydrolase family 31 protein [bacterium]
MEAKSLNCPTFVGKKYRITILSERLIRFEYSETGTFLDDATHFAINRDFEKTNIDITEDSKHLVVTSENFAFQYTKEMPFFSSKLFPDSNLRVKLNGTDKMWFPNHAESRNFRSNGFNLETILKLNTDKALYSTDGFVSIDDSKGLVINKRDNVKTRVDGNVDIYLFMYRRDFAGCLKDFYKLSGHPPLIPKYALGIWWNRDRVYSEKDVMYLLRLFEKYDIPLSVYLSSEFWHEKDETDINLNKTGYTFSSKLFPAPKQFIEELHKKNIKLGINFDPVEGISNKEDVYDKFLEKFPSDERANIPFNILDEEFSKLFINEILTPLKNIGVDFLWLDYQEDKNKLAALNYYVKKMGFNERGFSLTRNFGVGAHRYPALYSGETRVGWKTLDCLPNYNSGASNHGFSWWSHDVGGFKDGTEDNELYMRYVQFSVFNPIFRFSAKRGPYYKREPWLWDVKTLTIVKNYCDLRYRMIPYIYSEGYKYHTLGIPLSQPLYYNTPFIYDEVVYKNEYFFGSEFLIAAITKPINQLISRSIEKIYLPEGTWYDFRTGKKFIGDKRYVTFYKAEDYPIFVKAGGVVPLSVLGPVKNDLSNPKTIELNVFPGKSNLYKFYEDDGDGKLNEEGDYLITAFDYNYMQNNYTLIIRPLEGKSGIVPEVRNYIVKFRNTKRAEDVTLFLNGEIYEDFEVSNDDTNFVIDVKNVDTTKQLTINCKGKDIEIDATHIFYEDVNAILFDTKIPTNIKEELAEILFSDRDLKRKRILVNKLKVKGLNPKFATMFLKLLEYSGEI